MQRFEYTNMRIRTNLLLFVDFYSIMTGFLRDFQFQNYPRDRHPGWNKGSIAYHAGELDWQSVL